MGCEGGGERDVQVGIAGGGKDLDVHVLGIESEMGGNRGLCYRDEKKGRAAAFYCIIEHWYWRL